MEKPINGFLPNGNVAARGAVIAPLTFEKGGKLYGRNPYPLR